MFWFNVATRDLEEKMAQAAQPEAVVSLRSLQHRTASPMNDGGLSLLGPPTGLPHNLSPSRHQKRRQRKNLVSPFALHRGVLPFSDEISSGETGGGDGNNPPSAAASEVDAVPVPVPPQIPDNNVDSPKNAADYGMTGTGSNGPEIDSDNGASTEQPGGRDFTPRKRPLRRPRIAPDDSGNAGVGSVAINPGGPVSGTDQDENGEGTGGNPPSMGPSISAGDNDGFPLPPLHDHCHCTIETMPSGRKIWRSNERCCDQCDMMRDQFNDAQAQTFGS